MEIIRRTDNEGVCLLTLPSGKRKVQERRKTEKKFARLPAAW